MVLAASLHVSGFVPSSTEHSTAMDEFLRVHRHQLETSGIPHHLWDTLRNKLDNAIFDAGTVFSLMQEESEEGDLLGWKAVVVKEEGIQHQNEEQIYLIDHAWTFRPRTARDALKQIPGLLSRMAALFDINIDESTAPEELIDRVMSVKWRYANTYWVGNADSAEERVPVWYVMDEFGARIQHSDSPNVRIVPFFYAKDGSAYSLLFPACDLSHMEEITRDYLEGPEATDAVVRKALMNTWQDVDMTNISPVQKEPEASFFMSSRKNETLPSSDFECSPLPTDRKIKVYAEYKYIGVNLTHPRFEMVEERDEADIIWQTTHFKDFKSFSETYPAKRINQFPFENIVTIKDLLCIVARRMAESAEDGPKWLPVTYNLKTELPQFVSYFQAREKRGEDNHWIVKPWNLARGLDMHISKDLHHILRTPISGPKIAQKYIDDPVLFDRPDIGRVKFDIRYILLLSSVHPLKIYAYDRFWLRFANVPFDLTNLDDYEKHFTVMNYEENATDFKQMFCHDFVKLFEAQYPDVQWKDVEKDIFAMFKSVFEGATKLSPPCGIGRSPQSRAMFASDLMLAWETDPHSATKKMVPKILEINWGPDCKRACDYYPEYFNNVFSTLYLEQPEGQNVTLL